MAEIELRQVEKRFGDLQAVKPMDLTVYDGEFIVLLGPSGCGKTTTLRMISGLEAVTGGHIFLDGRDVTWLHPSDRDIAFVFQLFALYPHMTARENIAFPLQAQGESEATINNRLDEVVALLRIHRILDERPGKLSGGDRQRVALARALVRRPKAFLMDEPLGALDAEFREAMRAEIKRLHIDQHATTVYVTHDQIEAMAMGDRIVVMSKAEIQQAGTPAEVYYDPANLFVANFIGSPGMNLVTGHYTANGTLRLPGENHYPVPESWQQALRKALGGQGDVVAGFRPEAARFGPDGALSGEVYASDLHGAHTMLHVNFDELDIVHIRADRMTSVVPTGDSVVPTDDSVVPTDDYPIGTPVRFDIDPNMVRFFHPDTEAAIDREAGS